MNVHRQSLRLLGGGLCREPLLSLLLGLCPHLLLPADQLPPLGLPVLHLPLVLLQVHFLRRRQLLPGEIVHQRLEGLRVGVAPGVQLHAELLQVDGGGGKTASSSIRSLSGRQDGPRLMKI